MEEAIVNPLLTDMYQLTMAFGYFKNQRHLDSSVFDVFFRKCPFRGEYAIFAGLSRVLAYVKNFRFGEKEIEYLRKILPQDEEFFQWIKSVDCSQVKIYSVPEGSVVFPRTPVLRIEGPIAVCQLLETTILNLVNYATLMTTNATRFRMAAGPEKQLIEFGLRRAQGPDGALSSTKYSYMGLFDGTSNVLGAAQCQTIPKGTHAHAFVSCFINLEELKIRHIDGRDMVQLATKYRSELNWLKTNDGELAAFIAYAISFPDGFLALVDTYDTLNSGLKNFIIVALALQEIGHKPVGIRLDSGDLAFLSCKCRQMFKDIGLRYNLPDFGRMTIVASNDINEEVIHALNKQGHEIDVYGIGTHLVTCQKQPALGMVYKLVEINGQPRIKLSNDKGKITIPGRKNLYRFYNKEGIAVNDLLTKADEKEPQIGQKTLCKHPFEDKLAMYVNPSKVQNMLLLVFDNGQVLYSEQIEDVRTRVRSQLKEIREDVLRFLNPTPHKISLSQNLYDYMQQLWVQEQIIPEYE